MPIPDDAGSYNAASKNTIAMNAKIIEGSCIMLVMKNRMDGRKQEEGGDGGTEQRSRRRCNVELSENKPPPTALVGTALSTAGVASAAPVNLVKEGECVITQVKEY